MTYTSYPGSVLSLQPAWKCGILIVAAEESARSHMTALLAAGGYTVCAAASGFEALQMLDSDAFNIVIADCNLPGMDGATLCRALRLRDSEQYIYILLQAAKMADVLPGLAAGADDYLLQDAEPPAILARVAIGQRLSRLEHVVRASEREKRDLSSTDPLTGARDRRFLLQQLPRELDRSRRYHHPFAILSCDLDGWQRTVEVFGHEAGEDVLRTFVQRCLGNLRESIDWIARAGEQQFVVVLPETDLVGATVVAEKLRASLTSQPISTRAGTIAATVSIGATAIETDQELGSLTVTELLHAADRCLHVSKHLGRDRSTAVAAGQVGLAIPLMLSGMKYGMN